MLRTSVLITLVLLPFGFSVAAQDYDLVPVRVQLQWVAQAQFAGYFIAQEFGYYVQEGLDVTLAESTGDLLPVEAVDSGDAHFGLTWMPKVLKANRDGANLVNIAQIFRRRGTVEVSLAASGIESAEDLSGKRVGYWGADNEFEVFAALRAAGIDPYDSIQVSIVPQPFHLGPLLAGDIDAGQALIYNGYGVLLGQINPATGELFRADDLNVIDVNEVSTAMLQDHIFADADWLAEDSNEALAVALLKATFRGWIHCRDYAAECVDSLLAINADLGASHQLWQMNEVNRLIWASTEGIGIMDGDLWDQTLRLSSEAGIVGDAPEDAWRADLAQAALDALHLDMPEIDVTGADWQPDVVEVREGGQ